MFFSKRILEALKTGASEGIADGTNIPNIMTLKEK